MLSYNIFLSIKIFFLIKWSTIGNFALGDNLSLEARRQELQVTPELPTIRKERYL